MEEWTVIPSLLNALNSDIQFTPFGNMAWLCARLRSLPHQSGCSYFGQRAAPQDCLCFFFVMWRVEGRPGWLEGCVYGWLSPMSTQAHIFSYPNCFSFRRAFLSALCIWICVVVHLRVSLANPGSRWFNAEVALRWCVQRAWAVFLLLSDLFVFCYCILWRIIVLSHGSQWCSSEIWLR